jgi:hypothetical protein
MKLIDIINNGANSYHVVHVGGRARLVKDLREELAEFRNASTTRKMEMLDEIGEDSVPTYVFLFLLDSEFNQPIPNEGFWLS